jgi:5-oxoprolinase (ATP-hydrolysing) subunit C
MFDVLGSGLFRETQGPVYGNQDQGIAPGGALDLFSFLSGNALLDNPEDAPALEMILPPRLKIREDGWFVLTGASFDRVTLTGYGGGCRDIGHGRVYKACPGQELVFGEKRYGFRAYLCYRLCGPEAGPTLEGRSRGVFDRVARWPDPDGLIRVIRGPEYSVLTDPDEFFAQRFAILPESNAMGLRLKARLRDLAVSQTGSMVSGPVNDGTVQMTHSGPVLLLRHRQTVGGYPRVFNVIAPDLDRLAQYAPGQYVEFKEICREEALDVHKKWVQDLFMIRSRF